MKYYYTCPLEAAYMAKNFGVKLFLFHDSKKKNQEVTEDSIFNFIDAVKEHEIDIFKWKPKEKIYVDPESEEIFVPKHRDVLIKRHIDIFGKRPPEKTRHLLDSAYPFDPDGGQNTTGTEIIMRDGKHFFMPKTDAQNSLNAENSKKRQTNG